MPKHLACAMQHFKLQWASNLGLVNRNTIRQLIKLLYWWIKVIHQSTKRLVESFRIVTILRVTNLGPAALAHYLKYFYKVISISSLIIE